MSWSCRRAAGALLSLVVLAGPLAADDLAAHGLIAPGGTLTLEIHGTPGAPTLLVMGAGFAVTPVLIKGGLFHVDLGQPWFLFPLLAVPPFGFSTVPLPIPPDPLLLGAEVHLHAAAPQLSPAASVRLHPAPTVLAGSAPLGGFGEDLELADLDGDGRPDLLVGAPRGGDGSGELALFDGPTLAPLGLLHDPTPQSLGRFGHSVLAGDVVGDPALDLIVAAPGAGAGNGDDTGEVWIFTGPAFTDATQLAPPQPAAGSGFGTALSVGDFDGDGDDDLAVGSPGSTDGGQAQAGLVHVFRHGDLALTTTLADPTPEAGALFGAVLAVGADYDLDGDDDLVVGVTNATVVTIAAAGEAWRFDGPLDGAPLRIAEPHPSGTAAFACRLEPYDVLGDGRPDLVVAVPGGAGTAAGNPQGVSLSGEVQVYGAGGTTLDLLLEDPTPEFFQHFGMDVQPGDFDGDGHLDLAVGVFLADLGFTADAGEVLVFMGPDFVRRLSISAEVPEGGGQFGVYLEAGDLDGDGADELVVSEIRADPGGVFNGGRVVIHRL